MIEYQDFHHVSITVTNLDKAKKFYGNILGFQELERPNFDFPGAWYQIGSIQLHLIVYPTSETLRSTNKLDSKDGHIAIRVKDYYHTLKYLKEKGVQLLEKPNSRSGLAQIFCMDTDGNQIEFNVNQEDLVKKTN